MKYQIVHRTAYTYGSTVSASYGLVCLLPRDTPAQRVESASVTVIPAPETYQERIDFFGNRLAHFALLQSHVELTVTTTSLVDVTGAAAVAFGIGPSWEEARDQVAGALSGDCLDARQFVLASPGVEPSSVVRDFAAPSFTPGRPLVDVLSDVTGRIYHEFAYRPGVTDLRTTADELIVLRQGVCQDFAHLQIACLRSFGLPARYVSGYLETIAPPGREKLQGADVSHAWVSAYVPTLGWIDVDPTNNVFVGNRHICTAWGRDYFDVSPMRGVIFTEAKTNTMTVNVDVTAVS